MRFSRLVVIERGQNTKLGQTTWRCLCDCGNEIVAQASNIKNEKTRSCGCIRKETLSEFNKSTKTTHNLSRTSEYRIWGGIMTRCFNKNDPGHSHYGSRGITVCDRWMVFENFINDMGKRPSAKHSIDRIDVNGNYSPENCRWATSKEQSLNKRDTILITHNGETKTIDKWAAQYGLNYLVIWNRLRNSKVGGSLFRPITPRGLRTKKLA